MPLRAGRRRRGLTARRNRFSALRSIASCLTPRHAVQSQSSCNEESRSRMVALPDFKARMG
ncbi:hypothetical protein PVAP13_1KG458320 [Panicum virgatum]|uniref:Uncharacterized protein n=1 Tax=Panicum virgatum TaxID=38727 RepID=A0A8T0XGQ6_PANVG|nr:hypothetical protein PVAP13_1KG458320 [Panicum virgatum]